MYRISKKRVNKSRFKLEIFISLTALYNLESLFPQELLDECHKIAFESNLPVHLVDLREDSTTDSLFDQLVKVLFEFPNVALDVPNLCDASLVAECHLEVHRIHKVLGALYEVRQILVLRRIWRSPTGRIFGLHFWLWDEIVADELLHVLPLRRVLDHLDIGMLLGGFKNFRRAIARRSSGKN